MIYECLEEWRLRNTAIARSTKIVLHTSCVNYTFEDLNNLLSMEFDYLIPNDVFWELRLMTKSKTFGKKAKYILTRVQAVTKSPQWDLTQVYQKCAEPVFYANIHRGPLIFLFGDLNKTDEFLANSRLGDKIYILISPSSWSYVKGIPVIMELNRVKTYRLRSPRSLKPGRPIDGGLTGFSAISLNRQKDRVIAGGMFVKTKKNGSNAYIYTCDSLPGMYVKGYKNQSMIETQKEKLQLLQKFGTRVLNLNAAFPVDLLYNQPSNIVGYSMKPISGKLLREYLDIGWDGHDLGRIFEQLLLILLELHTMHILVNDLSFNNILIDSGDHVGLVDCDSFQITVYPGGGITKMYQHPEISERGFSNELREPRHEYFALAVILFQCLFWDEPLRQVQAVDDDTELNWKNAVFPLDTDARSERANINIQNLWFNQPREVRKAFADEFCFRQDISIGTWIRVLDILN